jgi:hypothetical protein
MATAASVTKSKLGSIGQVAAGVFGGNVLTQAASKAKDFFTGSIQMAMNAEQANQRFATTLKNVAGATDKQVASAGSFLSSMSKQAAVSKGELRPAFESLLRGTGDITKAQGALQTALDISAGSGKPLAQVSQALTKGYLGNAGAVGRLGIATKDAAGKALSMDQIMQNANRTFGGQAAKQADTSAGRIKNMGLQMKALQTTVGQALMPIITQLSGVFIQMMGPIQTVANLFKQYPGIMTVLAAAIVGVVVAVKLYQAAQSIATAATGIATAATWLWNAALNANPIMLVVLAIIALIAILVIAYQKVGWFRDAVQAAWAGIQVAFGWITAAAQAVFNWLKGNWPLILGIMLGPIALAVALIYKYWDQVKSAATAVTSWVAARWQNLVSIFHTVAGAIGSAISAIVAAIKLPIAAATEVYNWVAGKFQALADVIGGIVGKVSGAVSSIANAIKGPINAVIRAWNGIQFTVPAVNIGPVHIGGQTIGLPKIPELAQGGYTLTQGLAWLHPAEVITPMASQAAAGSGGNVNIYVTVPVTANPVQTGRAVVDAIRSYESVAGTSWRRTVTGRP